MNYMIIKGLAPAYLVAFCTKGPAVGRSVLRSAVRGDLVVPSHRTDWGLRAFAVAGPSYWNELPVELRDLSVGPDARVHSLDLSDGTRTFEFVACVVMCNINNNNYLILLLSIQVILTYLLNE